MSDFKAKMHQIRFPLGLRPRPRWGTLQRSPELYIRGLLLRGRGGEVKGREKEGEGRGREGRVSPQLGSLDPPVSIREAYYQTPIVVHYNAHNIIINRVKRFLKTLK